MGNERAEVAPVTPERSQKNGLGLGCQIFVGLGLLALALFVTGVVLFADTVSWFANAAQPKPVSYPPVHLSAKEELELRKIEQQLVRVKANGQDLDILVSPNQLNAFLEGEKQRKVTTEGKEPKKTPAVRFSFEGEDTVLRASISIENKHYLNLEVAGRLSVRDGKPKLRVKRLKLGGQDAPWLVMAFLQRFLPKLEKATFKDRGTRIVFETVKVLERQGSRIHLVLDGKKLQEAVANGSAEDADAAHPEPEGGAKKDATPNAARRKATPAAP